MNLCVCVCVDMHKSVVKKLNYISHTRITKPNNLIKPALQLLWRISYELTISHEIFKGPESQKHIICAHCSLHVHCCTTLKS